MASANGDGDPNKTSNGTLHDDTPHPNEPISASAEAGPSRPTSPKLPKSPSPPVSSATLLDSLSSPPMSAGDVAIATLAARSGLEDDELASPRSSMDVSERVQRLEAELEATKAEKETLGNQYRSLLGKLTGMRQSLGEKLREDAVSSLVTPSKNLVDVDICSQEELDRRETAIHNLQNEIGDLQQHVETLKAELVNVSQESTNLQNQLAQLRSQSDSSSSDVLSLTREMRELRGEMERLRVEREEWEAEASRERERRETMEDEVRGMEKRERDSRRDMERAGDELMQERERASNLQDVLSEFQASKSLSSPSPKTVD